ncbi:flagellar biosynthetic protein FliR [Flavisphingomonas formosensis]|uniref:flagellar biosynthetic protein FliR n=1 Tax=Flavisphingomonas formosensis TaxID=861534 RepID=UPI0012FBBC4E|nr:flagellar biosynthetic protein FliR [Sphingomonas formosensis]
MPATAISAWLASCLLLSLRIAPTFAWGPPFSLVRAPLLVRLLLALGLAAATTAAMPTTALVRDLSLASLLLGSARELLLGGLFALAFQLVFAALYLAGRTIDIQAGFGLAVLVDPTTRTQTPLVGTLFAYAAGAVFFATDGHLELLRLIVASLDAVPLGNWVMADPTDRLAGLLSTVSLIAFGFAGAAALALFLIDVVIALLARTVPQMNVLVLGFQVKTLALLAVLPLVFGLSAALLARMLAIALETLPRLI